MTAATIIDRMDKSNLSNHNSRLYFLILSMQRSKSPKSPEEKPKTNVGILSVRKYFKVE